MITITATTLAVAGCVALAALHDPRWLLVGGAVGVAGFTAAKRYRVP